MKVNVRYRNDPERGLTDPLPEIGGRRLIVRVYSGDYCDPFGDPDGWFGSEKPRVVLRAKLSCMPFIAWRWNMLSWLVYPGLLVAVLSVALASQALAVVGLVLSVLGLVAILAGDRAGYIGFKLYGADSDAYRSWMKEGDVYEGSQACHFSIRPFANLTKG